MTDFGSRCDRWRATIKWLDGLLRPIATRPVDITDPAWVTKLREHRNPLDEAGVRHDAQQLILDMIEWYPTVGDARREAIRKLVAAHASFVWAAGFLLPFRATDAPTVRQQLMLFSILDQGVDSRDAILWLRAFCAQAQAAGVDLPALLSEIATLSSSTDRFGSGSTQTMLRQL